MRFLNRKLKRDILRNWTQFFSVFLMAFLSVLVYVGLEGAWHGMEISVNTFIEESDLAHSWIHAVWFRPEDIDIIKDVEGVVNVSTKTRLQVSSQIENANTYLLLETLGTENISNPLILFGENISSELEGVWLNLEYAKTHNISVGDEILIEFHGREATIEVLGIILSPNRLNFTGISDFVAPNAQVFGYGVISDQVLEEKFAIDILPNFMEILGEDSNLRYLAPDILEERFIAYYNRNTLFEVSNAIDRAGSLRGLSFLFASLFVFLSVLTMYTTIKRLIETQIKDIATLKALGISNRTIGFHYSSYGLLIGGLGAILGAVCAPLISNIVLETQQGHFSLPSWAIAYTPTSVVVMIMVTLICAVSAFLAAKKSKEGLPALFLRGNIMKMGKPIFLEKIILFWGRLQFSSKWAIRDGISNSVRILMGIVGVSGGMMLLMGALGAPDTLYAHVENSFQNELTYAFQLRVRTTNTNEQNNELRNELNGQWIQRLSARTTPDDGFDRILTIFDDGPYVQIKTLDGESMGQEGVYLTEGFANSVGLEIGDTISFRVSMDVSIYEFQIMGILRSSAPQGIYIHAELWENEGASFQPLIMLVGDDATLDELRDDYRIEQIITIGDQKDSALSLADNIWSISQIIISFAILLVIIILYNLGALNFTERTRDYATLHVLGLHKKEIRKLTMRENLITTLVGWLLGIPLGYWFLEQYVGAFSSHQIVYYPQISIQSLLIASSITIVCSMSTTFLLGRRMKNVDMVEALKGIE